MGTYLPPPYDLFVCHRVIVGASFRNTGEILELAGCDFLTISPALLDELQNTEGQVPKKLDAKSAEDDSVKKVSYINNEPEFRYPPSPPCVPVPHNQKGFITSLCLCYCSFHLTLCGQLTVFFPNRFYFNEDQMAVEKLSDGIRKFAADAETLKSLLKSKIEAK
jgi:transaldolase